MHLTKKQIAQHFSNGEFELIYAYLSEDIEWNVINDFQCKGKSEVISKCEGIASYFASITTDFRQIDHIESHNKVVITGTAELSKDGRRVEFISACDVCEFDSDNLLLKVTSYCLVQNY